MSDSQVNEHEDYKELKTKVSHLRKLFNEVVINLFIF